jgi:hypothetical protein
VMDGHYDNTKAGSPWVELCTHCGATNHNFLTCHIAQSQFCDADQ